MSSTTDNNTDQCSDGGEMISSKNECTSCEQNCVNNINEGINSVAILGNKSKCASCGKEGNIHDMNTCNKCKEAKYCNAACKKKHRTKHKKTCERRVAELHDEQLFKDPPPPEECPICLLPLPDAAAQTTFKSCCGKLICNGCILAMKISEGKDLCAFCRTPRASSPEEEVKRVRNLMEKGIGDAIYNLAGIYANGSHGMPQDYQKANKLLLKAGELGHATAYFNLGTHYKHGLGVERDKKKSKKHYYELAAINGHTSARHNLGCDEGVAGNYDRAKKHFIIAARAGHKKSLNNVKEGFKLGLVTKDDYASSLRAYHERQKEMNSDMRVKAAACYHVSKSSMS